MKLTFTTIFTLIFINVSFSQILDNSLFKIYRAEFVDGAVTHLRIDKNHTYEMSIAEFHCSLCDFEELKNIIESKGTWIQENDTLKLSSDKKIINLRFIDDSLLKPIYPIAYKYELTSDSIKALLKKDMLKNDAQDFHLIYDTYPNGVAKLIIDKYRMIRGEYEIELKSDGTLKKVDYYWDNKKKKRIR
jgi:hypothetical protein